MSWRRHFRVIRNNTQPQQVVPTNSKYGGGSSTSASFSSFLPLVYAGHPNRIARYYQFDDMDRDSDINAALDTIADFCTQSEEQTDEPFVVHYNSDPSESETKILKTMLSKWTKLNNFRARLWYTFRDTVKNGDAFYLRDPETQEWLWLDHFLVEMVKVDDTMGKRPDEYLIRGLDYNRQTQFGSKQADPNQYRTPFGTSNVGASRNTSVSMSSAPAAFSLAGTAADPRQRGMMGPFSQEVSVVDANFVVHLSLSIGNDINWPFGVSILEPIFKTYKQKELLEDAIIIYRVQRAPERRIFYVDVGTMPPERAKRHIEMIKNDIHQRRIPNRTGGGNSILDAAYNPLCLALDTRIPLLDGRTLTLSELIEEHRDGKENWTYSCDPMTGEIMPGPITWAGVTKKDAEVLRITLDNGKTLVCTPDHKIPVLGRGFVEAQNLTPDDSLIAFHTEKNLKLVGIEPIGTMDVGTVTIDGDERFHSHHTFATESGIFVKNSINDDYFFAQCLRLDTGISLLDGRMLTLQQVIDEHLAGKTNWVYSLNLKTRELEAGRISWAGVTRRDAEMLRVTLDNGEHVDATPDHRFILRDGTEKEASDLQVGDSLMPLYLREGRTGPRQKNAGYTRYLCNATSKTKFVHTTMCPKPPGREWVTHHKDHNGKNNNPTNLEVMSWQDHVTHHSAVGTYSLGKQWSDPTARAKIITGMHRLYENADDEFWQMLSERNRANGANTWADPEIANRVKNSLRTHCDAQLEKRRLRFSIEMFERLVEVFNGGFTSVSKITKQLRIDEKFQNLYRQANTDVKRCRNGPEIGWVDDSTLNKVVAQAGYSSWGDFKKHYARNHKVVSVERLPYTEDTGDITVESASDSHVFALAAGVYVHNSADGRGSKVETLPGGESTGEITDLMFFSRKLARGLRVPTSYLNLGEEEGNGITFNDGKLGAAMIQEFRFTKYCMRLQNLLAPKFDSEFKRFLIKNGIEMEWSLFELQFVTPQSFTKYRQIELDAQRVQVYQGVSENRRLAERFKLKRFLGLNDDEILENETLWSEENAAKLKAKSGATPAETDMADGLSSVGVRPMGDELPPEMPPEPGQEGMMPGTPGMPGAPGPAPPGGGGMPTAPGGMPGAGPGM